MLYYFLFILYFMLLGWGIIKLSFVKNAGLDTRWILGLFTIKIIAGVVIGYCSLHFYGIHNDYWDNNTGSIQEYTVLKTNPKYFFSELIFSNYNGSYGDFWSNADSYWNDLKNNCLIKFMAFFNLLSNGHYYINSLFYNSIIFIGHVGLYRLFKKIYPSFNYGTIIGCFLLPSFIYFSSGIHRDGFVFILVTTCLYCAYSILEEGKKRLKFYLFALMSIGLLFILRNVVAITLLPVLFAWWASKRFILKPSLVFSIIGLLFLFTIMFAGKFSSVNPLDFVADKQADYMQLEMGNTPTGLPKLVPTATGFLFNTPIALANVLLRPLPGERPYSLIPFSIELLIYYLCFISLLFRSNKKAFQMPTGFLSAIILFTFLNILFIGHIIPNLGAIIRYRSIFLPFVMIPVLYGICEGKVIKYKK